MKNIYGMTALWLCSFFSLAQSSHEPPLANTTYIKSVKKLPKANAGNNALNAGIFENTVPKLIPATPQAAALGKYGNVPVSHYTGIPNISIPLYQLSQKDLSLDLGLSYHAGGIRVEELAPWTGLGWSLTGLGTISKTVRGSLPDEKTNGYINTQDNLSQIYAWYLEGSHYNEVLAFSQNVADPSNGNPPLDSESDLYTFNFGKYSGKFFFNRTTAEFYTIPRQNLKLEHSLDYSSWTITTEEGIQYVFAARDYTNSTQNSCTGVVLETDNNITTSWQLTQIISPTDANNNITITYSNEVYSLKTLGGATKKNFLYSINTDCPCNYSNSTTNCITETSYTATKVNEITFRNGKIKFESQANNRCDLANTKALENITIYDASNTIVKKINFHTSYFGASSSDSNCGQESFTGRLRLDSLAIFGTSNTLQMPPYIFKYERENPPARLSYAQDYWGFYNEALANTDLIPDYYYPYNNSEYRYLSGANRKANHEVMAICQLKEITYPTGGKTLFEFEGNKARSTVSVGACDPSRCLPENINTQNRVIGFSINSNTFDVATFTINQPANCVNRCQSGALAHLITSGPALGTSLSDVQYQLTNSAGTTVAYISSVFDQFIYLANETYTLTAVYYGTFTPADLARIENTSCTIAWDELQNINDTDVLVGGLRIKKITDIDQNGNQHFREYAYLQENASQSSGIISTIPQNTYLGFLPTTGSSAGCITPTCVGAYRSAESVYPLITTQGANVGYDRVKVTYGGNNTNDGGKSIYTYTPVITHISPNETPIVPPYMVEWKEGLPISTQQFNTSNKILQQDSLAYYALNTTSSLYQESVNVRVHKIATTQVDDGNGNTLTTSYFAMNAYRTPTDWLYQNFSQERTYHSDHVNYTRHEKFTEHNTQNLMPSILKEVNSVGDTLKTIFKYPHDYYNDSTVYAGMVTKHQIAPTIQQEEYVRKAGASVYTFLAKKLNLYHQFHGSFYALDKVLTQENAGLLTQRMKMEYYPDALISSYTERNGIKTSFNWYGANDTGKRDLLKTVVKGDGTAIAQTTSYDYKPLVGMMTQTDPKGLSTTFDYDALNRLKTIKDSEGKIVKDYTYQYANDRPSEGGSCSTPAPVITSAPATAGCNTVLTASGCLDGVVHWSNGQTGNAITVPSVLSPVYTATCNTACTSPASNALAGLTYPAGWTADNIVSAVNGCIVLGNASMKMQTNSTPNKGVGGSENDHHYFYSKEFAGDVTIMAKVNGLSPYSGVRAGIMFKAGLSGKDIFFSIVQDGDNSNAVGKLYRQSTNADAFLWKYQLSVPAGIWLRIKKVGNVIQSYYSTLTNPSIGNESDWTPDMTSGNPNPAPNITWPTTFRVGFTLENPTANSPAEVIFTHVQIDDNGSISNL